MTLGRGKPQYRKGQALKASDLQSTNSLVPLIMTGKVSRLGDRFVFPPETKEKTGDPIFQAFIIESIEDDHLVCSTVEDENVRIPVAKPHLIQRTPFDGESITYPEKTVSYSYSSNSVREASSGGDTETQKVTPPYYVGELLIGIRVYAGFEVTVDTIDDVPVHWVDSNNGGREWAVPEGD